MTISNDVFPDPEGPTMPTVSPAKIEVDAAAPRPPRRQMSTIGGRLQGQLPLEGLDCYSWVMAFSIINLSAHNAQTHSRRYGLWVALVNAWIIIASPAWAEQVNIIAIGDSLTAGYGLAQSRFVSAQLQAALRAVGEEVRITNSGVSGDLSRRTRPACVGAVAQADAVILELGANDGLRGLDPGQTEANLNEMITEIQAQALPVLLTGMLASAIGPGVQQ